MQQSCKPIIVLVSAYSTGRFLPYMFKGNGYECIHITAHPNMPEEYTTGYSENKFLFLEDIKFNNDLDFLINKLKKYPVKSIIPGSESGVHLADMLIEGLGLNENNDPSLSLARRDKYLMQEALKNKGVNHIPSFVISNIESLRICADKLSFPIVLKPLASSDAQGVHFCYNLKQLEEAFTRNLGNHDLYDQKMANVILQKKMEGKEFVVNSISRNGEHVITDIWTNDKMSLQGELLYDYQDFIAPSSYTGNILSVYIKTVLDALGIRFGAGHSEVILTESGPVLIEIGARLAGAFDPSAMIEALGYSQLSMLVNSYLHPTAFVEFMRSTNKPKPHKMIKIVSLASPVEGKISNLSSLNYFKSLKSFFNLQHSLNVNQQLLKTNNLTNSPGNVYLISEDTVQLERDYISIRENEKSLYHSFI